MIFRAYIALLLTAIAIAIIGIGMTVFLAVFCVVLAHNSNNRKVPNDTDG